MVTQFIDKSADFNADGFVNLDVSGWDYVVWHLVTPTGEVNFNTSNDGGAVTGSTQSNAVTAINFQPVLAINTATGVGATSSSGNGLFKVNVAGRYIQLIGSSVTVSKLLFTLSKIC